MRAVLDTSVVLSSRVARLEGELAISAATLAELHFGVLVATEPRPRAERLRRLAVVERSFDPLPVDAAVARSYGLAEIVAVQPDRASRGRPNCG